MFMAAAAVLLIMCAGEPAALGARKPGKVSSREYTYNVKGFSGIRTELDNSWSGRRCCNWPDITINVTKGDRYKVSVDISDPEYRDIVYVEKSGNCLLVRSRGLQSRGRRYDSPKVVVNVQTPELEYLDLSGTAKVNVSGQFSSDAFDAVVSGAAQLRGLDVKVRYATLGMSGASSLDDVNISASEKCKMNVSGAGEICGIDVKSEYIEIYASGASKIRSADFRSDRFDMDASGAASISGYTLLGEVSMGLSGAAAFRCTGCMSVADVRLAGAADLEFSMDACGRQLDLECSGGSSANLESAPFRDVNVSAYGASRASVRATVTLRTDIARSASLDYYGHPENVFHQADNIRSH